MLWDPFDQEAFQYLTRGMMIFSKWNKYINEEGNGGTLLIDLGFQTNRFLAEEILCFLANDKSHSSTCYRKMS